MQLDTNCSTAVHQTATFITRNSENPRGQTGASTDSVWTRIAKGACFVLLASPVTAAARMLQATSPSAALSPVGSARSCGIVVDSQQNLSHLHPAAQAVATPYRWHAPCAADDRVFFSVSLSTSRYPAMVPLDSASLERVNSDFNELSKQVKVNFKPATTSAFQLTYAGLPSGNGGRTWGILPPWESTFPDAVLAYTGTEQRIVPADRLAALGAALGLNTFSGNTSGVGGFRLPYGYFDDNHLTTVMSPNVNNCFNITRFGPLDLAALAAKYGHAGGNVTINGLWQCGGIITSNATNNVLKSTWAQRNAFSQLSMVDDGSYPSIIGDSHLLLAPGSKVAVADVTETEGVVIIGNNQTNTMLGAVNSQNRYVAGTGITNIYGGSHDVVYLRYDDTQVFVHKFFGTITVVPMNHSKNDTITRAGSDVKVSFDGGASLTVVGLTDTDALKVAKFDAPWRPVQCSSTAPGAKPYPFVPNTESSSGDFDPCAHIGEDGFGGAASTCLSGLGVGRK